MTNDASRLRVRIACAIAAVFITAGSFGSHAHAAERDAGAADARIASTAAPELHAAGAKAERRTARLRCIDRHEPGRISRRSGR